MKGKLKFMVILLILLMPVFAFTRIGETVEECEARYGKTLGKENNELGFRKGGFWIKVTFYQGIAESVSYIKEGPGIKISDNEIAILLQSNSGGKKWKECVFPVNIKGMKYWETEDGALIAIYHSFDHIPDDLFIVTKDSLDRQRAKEAKEMEEKEKDEKKRLEGF